MKLQYLTTDSIAMAVHHSCVSKAGGSITNLGVINYLMQRAMDSHPKYVGNHQFHSSQFKAEMKAVNNLHEGLYKELRPAFDAYFNSDSCMMIVSNSVDAELLILIKGTLFPSKKDIIPMEFVHNWIPDSDTVEFAVDTYQNVTNADLIRILGMKAASSV